jgi:hypothetical protein
LAEQSRPVIGGGSAELVGKDHIGEGRHGRETCDTNQPKSATTGAGRRGSASPSTTTNWSRRNGRVSHAVLGGWWPHRGASPEPRDAATPKRPLSPSASGVCLGRWPKPWDGRPAPGGPSQPSGPAPPWRRGRWATGRASKRRARPLPAAEWRLASSSVLRHHSQRQQGPGSTCR